MAAVNQISMGMTVDRTLSSSSSSRNIGVTPSPLRRTLIGTGKSNIPLRQYSLSIRSEKPTDGSRKVKAFTENGAFDVVKNLVFFNHFLCFLVFATALFFL